MAKYIRIDVQAAGRKGGRARANNLTAAARRAIAQAGGRARARKMGPRKRSASARAAAQARWAR